MNKNLIPLLFFAAILNNLSAVDLHEDWDQNVTLAILGVFRSRAENNFSPRVFKRFPNLNLVLVLKKVNHI